MLLNELLSHIPAVESGAQLPVDVRGLAYDSRLVKPGDLFVAIRGQKTDGARFISQAIRLGAVAVAAEDPQSLQIPFIRVPDARIFLARASGILYQDPSARLKLVAITGTNGKTTTSYIVEAILRRAGLRTCLAGTTGMRLGDRPLPCDRTTPESSDLMLFLHQAVLGGCTHGVLEVSSHALILKRVFEARFTVGVFTNLTQDHLDFHGDMESYFRAKRMMFTAEGGNGIESAVVNTDDAYGRRLVPDIECRVIGVGFDAAADVHVLDYRQRPEGTSLELGTPWGRMPIETRLLGRPNVYNVLASVGAAFSLGMDADAIREGIESLPGVPGRMEQVVAGQPFLVLVDYAHTPDALEKMLTTARSLAVRRVITVFGCGGDRDRGKRPLMGEIAGRMSDYVVATSDNPRTEDPLAILGEIETGLRCGAAAYQLRPDRREAIGEAVSKAADGDVVVIAGKGHETYQVVGTESFPFDDREVARDQILKLAESRAVRH